MKNSKFPNKQPLSSQEYSTDYFLNSCDGHDLYKSTTGQLIPSRLAIPLMLAEIKNRDRIIDLGCGRGEVVVKAAQNGAFVWGVDFSDAALQLSQKTINYSLSMVDRNFLAIQKSKVNKLPFKGEIIDTIFMIDIVEHLNQTELQETLDESWRVLKYNGKVIIHTMPNLWYYKYGYPIFRLFEKTRGKRLPKNPRVRWKYSHVHINEQTPISLRIMLKNARFHTKIWLQPTQNYKDEDNPLVRFCMKILTTLYPFRWIFCNDIFAVGIKK